MVHKRNRIERKRKQLRYKDGYTQWNVGTPLSEEASIGGTAINMLQYTGLRGSEPREEISNLAVYHCGPEANKLFIQTTFMMTQVHSRFWNLWVLSAVTMKCSDLEY